MAWTLGSTTLPNPKGFTRRFIEKSIFHDAINGRTTRDITNRKEQFHLTFTKLKQSTVASVLSEFERKQVLAFTASDGDLSIASTNVHVEVAGRDYNTKGSEFREDFTLILTEVE